MAGFASSLLPLPLPPVRILPGLFYFGVSCYITRLFLIEERRIVFDIICCFFNISEREMYKPEMKRRLVSPTLRKIHLVMFLRKTEGKGDSRLADNNITSATM